VRLLPPSRRAPRPRRDSYGFNEYTGQVMEWRLQNIAVHPHHRHTQPCATAPRPAAQTHAAAGGLRRASSGTRPRRSARPGARRYQIVRMANLGNFSTWRVRAVRMPHNPVLSANCYQEGMCAGGA